MTQDTGQEAIVVRDGVLIGPVRRSRNTALDQRGSIHDDATASRLGFRGGTVAGSVHLDLFPPLLLRAFGPRWFEHGTLSLAFVNPTVDAEPVRAFLRQPEVPIGTDAQVEAWIEREDGLRVGEGTAAVGEPGVPTALGSRDLARYDHGDYRILSDIRPGDPLTPVQVHYTLDEHQARMAVITEQLPWYTAMSPWGGPIISPAAMVSLLYSKPIAMIRPRIGRAVGLFGAIELRNIDGPVFLDREYVVSGTVLARGQSPKTEYFWYETVLAEPDGRCIAGLLMQLRFMKASSPLWQEG